MNSFFFFQDLENGDNSMVCEVCQKSLAIFWTLIEFWLKARNWSYDDGADLESEYVAVKKERFDNDDLSYSNTDSKGAFVDNDEKDKCKKGQLAFDGSSNDASIKVEIDEIVDFNESVYFSTGGIKKELACGASSSESDDSKIVEIDEIVECNDSVYISIGSIKEEELACDGDSSNADVSKKVDTDEMVNCNGSEHLSIGGVKAETEENEDVEELQFKTEEVEIKDEDE